MKCFCSVSFFFISTDIKYREETQNAKLKMLPYVNPKIQRKKKPTISFTRENNKPITWAPSCSVVCLN